VSVAVEDCEQTDQRHRGHRRQMKAESDGSAENDDCKPDPDLDAGQLHAAHSRCAAGVHHGHER
jgi:hypothetical protein